jgi:hypothetical protein
VKGIDAFPFDCSYWSSSDLLIIINAAITPGTQPAKVNNRTIKTDPQPLSSTEKGGKTIAKITLSKFIK